MNHYLLLFLITISALAIIAALIYFAYRYSDHKILCAKCNINALNADLNCSCSNKQSIPKVGFSEFEQEISILISKGFKPIGCLKKYNLNAYVFQTEKEADDAFLKCGTKNILGYYYNKKEFREEIRNHYDEYRHAIYYDINKDGTLKNTINL